MQHRLGILVFLLITLGYRSASADGAWGRIHGDVSIQGDIGIGMDNRKTALAANLATRYLQTAGLYTTWMVPLQHNTTYHYTVSFGLELRPLFLPRFLTNRQSTSPRLSMTIDSLALRMGVVTADNNPYRATPGFETGFSIGIPLLQNVSGPWINASSTWRWPHDTMLTNRESMFVWTITFG